MEQRERRVVRWWGREYSRDLVVARLFYSSFFAAYGSLFPLLAVYFKQLGINAAQAGLLIGARPFVEFIARPFWGSFASRFKKCKVLLMFSLASFIVFTLAIGFVQPVTPYCIVKPENSTSDCVYLEQAGHIVRGGALGYLKQAAGIGTRKKRSPHFEIEDIVDLSSFATEDDFTPGIAPQVITREKVCNYDEAVYGVLVSPPHSTRVYRKPAVEQAFLLLLLLAVLGEFFSTPGLSLADGVTLSYVADQPKQFGHIRLYGSMSWGLAMLVMGIGLDFSDTFRNHPCPTKNTTEKNYTLCFVACSIFMFIAMLVATQFRFESIQHPDDVTCAVIDTRMDELSSAVTEKAQARKLQTDNPERSVWISAIRSLLSAHAAVYLLAVTTIGFGAGIIFAFLYWHLQDIGGSPVLFGVASVVNHGSEIAAYFYCFHIINKFGHTKVMYICLMANVLRFLLISLLKNPWMVLPLQVVQGFTLATVWASASSYISLVSPSQLKSTSQTILCVLYHGLGKGLGSIVGGFMIACIGTRATFRLYSLMALTVLAIKYGYHRIFKYETIKYSQEELDDDEPVALAPQGIPVAGAESKLIDAFHQTAVLNSNYGAIDSDPTQEAYDRYVNPSPHN